MFKYLLLKSYFKLSDRGLVERTQTNLLFKYFLGYAPEEIKLINKTVEIALEKGLIEVKNKNIGQ